MNNTLLAISIVCISLLIQMTLVSTQLTFSTDWKGGKRSSETPLANKIFPDVSSEDRVLSDGFQLHVNDFISQLVRAKAYYKVIY